MTVSNAPTTAADFVQDGTTLCPSPEAEVLKRMGIDRFVTNLWKPALPGVGLTEMTYHSGEYRSESPDFLTLGMVMSPFCGEVALASDKTHRKDFSVGEIGLVPCSAPYLSRLHGAASLRYVTLEKSLVRAALEDIDPEFDLDFGWLFQTGFRSPLVSALVGALFDDPEQKGDLATLRMASLVDTLVLELYRLSSPFVGAQEAHPQRLSDTELRKIDAHLDATNTQVTREDLARLLGRSSTRFARNFKATTGLTPYQYALQHRVQRAKVLLATTHRSLAQIAHDCGFSSQSHMTTAFRQRLGATPGQVRRNSR